ncbi:hypothetical protein GCM10027187_39770 [Streptosporangium sandarakinum]|uniref:Uncharacterized protein n=1 Tax=Streptosporangium sandarakinum TaxID=1260955 RepID=A0A852V4N8_9ACTN|nr:hypothetical protein [Streptosporangium sandarakinum]NYF44692.1 hypothetical protein [Streptosporangium sandarakinum]
MGTRTPPASFGINQEGVGSVELVTPEKVAVHAGVPTRLEPGDRAAIEMAIEDALAEVAAYLDRPPLPEQFTERGVVPDGRGGWSLNYDPLIEVVSATAETHPVTGEATGAYTLVYRAGLDPAADRRYGAVLARFVSWAAAAHPIVRRLVQAKGVRLQASVNVEGQGVTYESTQVAAGSGVAGAPPTLADLDGWVRHTVYQAPGRAPHPIETGAAWL